MILDLLRYPVINTPKSARLLENNQYCFDVDRKLTKPQIKKLIENYFNIKVLSINTHCPRRKWKRSGKLSRYKRVIITLNSKLNLLNYK
uniref:ribosomal protein L23 n=1 Tax=Prototheca miyajii TaxID=2034260 RepID=UPI0030031572